MQMCSTVLARGGPRRHAYAQNAPVAFRGLLPHIEKPMSVMAIPAGAYDKSASNVVPSLGYLWGCGFMALRSVVQEAALAKYFTTMVESCTKVASVTTPAP